MFAYVLDVNYVLVYLCAWWLVAIGEPYTVQLLLRIIYVNAYLWKMNY